MKDPLDKILQDWSARHQPPAQDLAQLERQTLRQMREIRLSANRYPAASQGILPWGRLVWFALGVACTLTVTALFNMPAPQKNGGNGPDLARNTATLQRLFSEIERQFGDNLRWVAQADGKMELGIDPNGTARVHGDLPFAVHLAVVARDENNGAWQKIWESDILTWSEQAIDLTPNRKHDNRVAIWIHPVDTDQFAVDTRLSLDLPVRILSKSTEIVQDGMPTAITTMIVGDREYRVYQTVTQLNALGKDDPCLHAPLS